MLKLVPLGGLGEIGLNMMVFEYADSLFVVDAGLMFPEDYMLGVDFVIPDMQYLKSKADCLAGIILTHAHEDHIGALPYLLKEIRAPIFGTPFTLGVVRHKLEEHDLLTAVELCEVLPREKIRLGVFDIEFIRMGHSVVDGVGLAVTTPYGLIVHTGDFKISHTPVDAMRTDVNRLAQLGDAGVLALLSDSTNVEKQGYTLPDREIGATLARITDEKSGRIIIALFASNIPRIQQIVSIAEAAGRHIVTTGRSIEVSISIARDLGYLHMPGGLEVSVEDLDRYPDDKIIIITTGSQGEPMSALARMSMGTHKQIQIRPDDTVVLSSKFIPGNEKAIAKIIDNLYRRGADVIYEKISDIHVSGHAFSEELKLMITLTKPEYFIPIHGEYRHLVLHARLAEGIGIRKEKVLLAENGRVVGFDEKGGALADRVPTGRVLIDGKGVGDVGRSVLKERRTLSEEGIVAVTMAFDEETGIVVYGPEIVSRGFVFEHETGHLLQDAQCVILEIVEDIDFATPDRVRLIRSRIRSALRKYFFYTIGRRPVILPFVLEV